jgi:transcriptional regulator with GAF, ATPase, and Fis domain
MNGEHGYVGSVGRWRVCLRAVGETASTLEPLVAQALNEAGVQTLPHGEPDVGAAVLVADEASAHAMEALGELGDRSGPRRVLVVRAPEHASDSATVWRLMAAGASDVLTWNPGHTARHVAARMERWDLVEQHLRSPAVRDRLVGDSPLWRAFLAQVVEIAVFTDAPVLLLGESGTGKELIARLIHDLDPRPARNDFVILDCSTVVPELSGSEFFGHERGAYTGAAGPRDGAFGLANGGTLFLDEIGELSPAMQAQLLRVVQEHAYKRVGGNLWMRSDFRLVCATNRDLSAAVAEGRFRCDLFHRIAGWECRVPPLRERIQDVGPLVRYFLAQLRPGEAVPELDAGVRDYLVTRPYPGNVRDLRQLVARICRRHVGPGPITAGNVPVDERPGAQTCGEWQAGGFERAIARALTLGVGLKEIGRAATDCAIRTALADEGGNLQRASRRLGITDRALQMRRAQRNGTPA